MDFLNFLAHSNLLNFLIAVALLLWVVNKFKLGAALENQQLAVAQTLRDAETQRDAALKELGEIESRMSALNQEADQLIADAQQTAENVAQAILQNAQKEADAIMANAQKRFALEQKTLSRELEHRLMREAIHAATQLLENTLTPDDKNASVEAFVENLPQLARQEAS